MKIIPFILGIVFAILPVSSGLGQISIENGETVKGSLNFSPDFDEFIFSTQQTGSLIISAGTDFGPFLKLFDADNNLVAERLGNGGDNTASLSLGAVPAGNYRITLGPRFSGGAGDYSVNFVSIPGTISVPEEDDGGAIDGVEAVTGNLPLGDLDPWTISADEGDRILVAIGSEFSPYLRAYDPNGLLVAYQFGNGGDRSSSLSFSAEESGDYMILVSGIFEQSGTYALTAANLARTSLEVTQDEGGVLPTGTQTLGTLFVGDMDLWRFSAIQGDRITIAASTDSRVYLALYDQDGNLVSSLGSNAGGGVLRHDNERTGVYYLMIRNLIVSTSGSYSLNLNLLRSDIEILSISDERTEVAWTKYNDLVAEWSDDLISWNEIPIELITESGRAQGGFYSPSTRKKVFVRSRWE